MIFKPHPYQRDCIDFLTKKKCAGVFADPGLGKTAIVLHLLDLLYWHQEGLRTLIIAPLRPVYSVWPEEIEKWDLDYLSYAILHGPKGDRERAVERQADIDLINVENLFWLFDDLPKYDVLVIDESSKFKNPTSKRFELLKKHLDRFDRRILLTGTPSPNGLMDLWSQIYVVDKGEALGKNITAYRRRFFDQSNYRNFTEWTPKSSADVAIQRHIAPMIRRIDAVTHLDLPTLVNHTVKIQLSEKAMKIYKGFEKQLFAELENGDSFVLSSAASAYNVCRQIANGRFYEPPGPLELVDRKKKRKVLNVHGLKIEALKELIGELQGKPLLVAYHFKHDLAQLLEAFGDVPVIGGGTSAADSARFIKRWNLGKIPLLLGHPQSMAHGINLQTGGNDVAWFSLTDNLEDYLQFVRRIYRQGVKGQTRVHHIVAEGTVDVAVMDRLKNKNANQQALLDALARYKEGKWSS